MNANRAIFLDRDGVINVKRENYVKSWEEFEFTKNIHEALKLLIEQKFKIIIVTNQSVINRKIITKLELDKIHKKMELNFLKNNIVIDAIFYCPHKPNEGCNCRKPKPGMIKKGMELFKLSPENCALVGDSMSDIDAGNKVKIKSYLTNEENLLSIVKEIIRII